MTEYEVRRMNGRYLVLSSTGRRMGTYTTRKNANRAVSRIKEKNAKEERKRRLRNRQAAT